MMDSKNQSYLIEVVKEMMNIGHSEEEDSSEDEEDKHLELHRVIELIMIMEIMERTVTHMDTMDLEVNFQQRTSNRVARQQRTQPNQPG
jgi:hypothetical protein